MSGSAPNPPAGNAAPPGIAEALGKNKQATAEVKQAADELAVAHAVLDTKLAQAGKDPELQRAVQQTDAVEKRLTRSAEKLDEVNAALEREAKRPH